jgi:hypothetical protein
MQIKIFKSPQIINLTVKESYTIQVLSTLILQVALLTEKMKTKNFKFSLKSSMLAPEK